MKKILLLALIAVSCMNSNKSKNTNPMNSPEVAQQRESLHDLCANKLDGTEMCFADFKGKKVMIVNTASKCGLTPQYTDLQTLYDKHKDSGFEIIGFPANDFMSQEPLDNSEIAAFCEKNYGVSFTMMEKITVKGDKIHPVYAFLTQKSKNGIDDYSIEWNFQKFLINEDGQIDKVISPRTNPMDDEIISWIQGK
jgi:glutathione peroxidase